MIYEGEPRRGCLYRARDGMILGVCKGLAGYLDVPVLWVRLIACGLVVVGRIWPMILLYGIAAILMKPHPGRPWEPTDDQESETEHSRSGKATLAHLKQTYDDLDRRLQRLEDVVTDREYDWERRLRQ